MRLWSSWCWSSARGRVIRPTWRTGRQRGLPLGVGRVLGLAIGSLGAYLSGLVLGNAKSPHRAITRSFAEGAGPAGPYRLFVVLGLVVRPPQRAALRDLAGRCGRAGPVAGRPTRVCAGLSAAVPLPCRQPVFISWAGLRGAIPIVLTTYPIVEGVSGARALLHIVFVLVVFFPLLQGPSLPLAVRRLGLVRPRVLRDVQVETAPLDVLDAYLLTLTATTLIVREGTTNVPPPGGLAAYGRQAAPGHRTGRTGRRRTSSARSAGVAGSPAGSANRARPARCPVVSQQSEAAPVRGVVERPGEARADLPGTTDV